MIVDQANVDFHKGTATPGGSTPQQRISRSGSGQLRLPQIREDSKSSERKTNENTHNSD